VFSGFSAEEGRIPIPESFFAGILPGITHLAELKVTLHVLWRLAAQVGHPRLVSEPELAADPVLIAALTAGHSPRPAAEWLREGLELAVARGTLLHLIVQPDGTPTPPAESWYLAHTPFNARWLAEVCGDGERPSVALASAEWLALLRAERAAAVARLRGDDPALEVPAAVRLHLSRRRPGIFELYEQNVGVITPLLAEQLAEAERLYPPAWIEEAFTEAVSYNKRNWKYISRILETWAAKGRDDGARGQDSIRAIDSGKDLTGKYAYLFNR